jgi:multiple sugar transport system permease protein
MATKAAEPPLTFRRPAWRGLLAHLALIAAAIGMLYPVLWMLSSSFKPEAEIFADYSLWPRDFSLHAYIEGWNGLQVSFTRFFLNSVLVSSLAVMGNVLACSMAAFAFARLDFAFKRTLFAIMLLTIMLPLHATLIPQYILFQKIGWVNTILPIVVPKFLAVDAFFIFLMVQFIRGIPRELDEAARIDGCGKASIFLRIILPLMVPALATTTIFTFIWTWNDFFSQLIYLTDPHMYTVPVALRGFVDSTSSSSWGSMFAMSVVSLVPVFLAFLFGQRFLIKGIATTGIK